MAAKTRCDCIFVFAKGNNKYKGDKNKDRTLILLSLINVQSIA